MIVGFTGTQRGMTQRQRATFRYLLGELQVRRIHLGDCVGGDAEAFEDARTLGAITVGHPPNDDKLRAFLRYDEELPPRPYLARNKDIVAEGRDGLIAAPKDFVRPRSLRGQGTWTTIGYAQKANRRIWIVFPDGTFKEEKCK